MTQPTEPVNQCDPGPPIFKYIEWAEREIQVIKMALDPDSHSGDQIPAFVLDLVNMAFEQVFATLREGHKLAHDEGVFDMRFHDCTLIFRNGAITQSLKVTPDGDRFRKIQDLFFDIEEEQKREKQS